MGGKSQTGHQKKKGVRQGLTEEEVQKMIDTSLALSSREIPEMKQAFSYPPSSFTWSESVLRDGKNDIPEHLHGFDPFLSFVNGFAGTTNLILTLFLCNPNTTYSKEEVYAQLNQKIEKLGLEEFLIGKGYEFSNTTDAKGGMKLGRNTIFRQVENISTTFDLLVERPLLSGSFGLNVENPMCANFWKMRGFAKLSELYLEFIQWSEKRSKDYAKNSKQYDHLGECVTEYVADLKCYTTENKDDFISKNRRLVEFSETSDLKWSTLQKKWNEELRRQLVHECQHKDVHNICKRLGIKLKDQSKTKKDMANKIVSKTKTM